MSLAINSELRNTIRTKVGYNKTLRALSLGPAVAIEAVKRVGAVASKAIGAVKSVFGTIASGRVPRIGVDIAKGLKHLCSAMSKGLKKIGQFFRFIFGAPKRHIDSIKQELSQKTEAELNTLGYTEKTELELDPDCNSGDPFNDTRYIERKFMVNKFGIKAHLARAELRFRDTNNVMEKF